MASKGDLVVLTSSYPHGTAETFLESEVPILAEEFRRVHLVPCRATVRSANPRPTPSGVADAASADVHGKSSISRTARFARTAGVWVVEELRREARQFVDPRAFARLQRYAVEGVRIAARVESLMLAGRYEPSDTIVYSYWSDALAVAAALLREKHASLRVVARAHRFDLYAQADPVLSYLPFRTQISRTLDRIFFVSEHGRSHALEAWHLSPAHAEVQRLGVRDSGVLSRASYGDRSTHCLELLSCSAAIPVKRLDRIASAAARLSVELPNVRVQWTHIGSGPEIEAVKEYAGRVSSSRVRTRFLGQLSNREVLEYYATNAVDVLINASVSEGVPVSMMEAFAHGVPVVAPAIDGIPEIVTNTSGVLFSAAASPLDIARAVVGAVADPTKHAGLRAGARVAYERRWDAVSNYRNFARTLRAVRGHTELPVARPA